MLKIMKVNLLYFLFIFFPFWAFAQSEKALSAQAEKAFLNGNYALSVTLWDSLHVLGYGSCASYFDAGNAYFRLHVPAKAVLNYERALHFSPEKKEIYDNLQLAAQNLPDYQAPEMPSFLMRQVYILGGNTWGILAIIFANLSLFLFYRHKYKGKNPTYYYALGATSLSLILYFQTQNVPKRDKTAIILQDSVAIKNEPGSSQKTIATLSVGTKVLVNEELGAWYNVEAGANHGWIEAKSVEKVME